MEGHIAAGHEAAGALVGVLQQRRYLLRRGHGRKHARGVRRRQRAQHVHRHVVARPVEDARQGDAGHPRRHDAADLLVQVLHELRHLLGGEDGEERLAQLRVQALVQVGAVRGVHGGDDLRGALDIVAPERLFDPLGEFGGVLFGGHRVTWAGAPSIRAQAPTCHKSARLLAAPRPFAALAAAVLH